MTTDDRTKTRPRSAATGKILGVSQRIWLLGAAVVVGTAAAVVIGAWAGAALARQAAARRLEAGELGAAERWLARARSLASVLEECGLSYGDWRTDLLGAECDRKANWMMRWRDRLSAAKTHGAPPERIEREQTLGEIQMGVFPQPAEDQMDRLAQSGATAPEIANAMLLGYLAREEFEKAEAFLSRTPPFAEDPEYKTYLTAVYQRRHGDGAAAESLLRDCLAAQPDNEMFRSEWVDAIEQQARLDRALTESVDFARRSQGSEAAILRLARALHKTARLDQCRALLAPRATPRSAPSELRAEIVQLEWDAGNPGEASRWFMDDFEHLASIPAPTKADWPVAAAPGQSSELFMKHCSACHGPDGAGHGAAGRNLFPRPRNLRTGKSQIVRTRNGVPTVDDIQQVLAVGMGGTSMKAFDKLTADDRRKLAEEVVRMRREGVREQLRRAMAAEGESVDEAELRAAVESCTTPGEAVRVPSPWPAGDAARGKEAFAALGCVKCHGGNGQGAADQSLFDDQGEPNRARDLVWEPFKGGRERESLYLRIVAGMPGTAHPAAWNLPAPQLVDVVEYVRSLAKQPERELTNHQRRQEATLQAYLAEHATPRLAPAEPTQAK